jgi:TRAP-type mannitol/chloroaromatic compound transport system permease small subunit
MMAGAYALSRNAHVRGDFLYRLWPPRVQAAVEFVLYLVFFFPGMLALVYAGIDYAAESWGFRPYGPTGPLGEISINSPAGVPVSPLKTILPVQCMRTGEWPQRQHDVEELEQEILRKRREEEAKMAAEQGGEPKEETI